MSRHCLCLAIAQGGSPTYEPGVSAALRIRIRLALVLLVLVTLPPLAVAGGLGIAASVAVLGLGAALTGLSNSERTPPPGAFWALLAFVLWASATTVWSPYERSPLASNALKIVAGVLVYWTASAALVHAAARHPRGVGGAALAAFAALLSITLLDLATCYGISLRLDPVQPGEAPESRLRDAEMNVGHGLTVALLLAPAVWVATARRLAIFGRWAAVGGVVATGVALLGAAALGGLWVGGLALGVAAVFALAGRTAPRAALVAAGTFAVISLIAAPLLAWAATRLAPATKAALPFSWEHRVEGWAFIAGRLREAPLLGHGFDASRTFDATVALRGFDMPVISLHPHNAGLQIWLETGLVGAALASLAIVALTRLVLAWSGHDPARAMAAAGTLAVAATISAVSYGVWQEWWWASLFLAGGLVPVLVSVPGRD